MHARSTTVRGDPQAVDDGIAMVRDEVRPALEEMEGCVGLSMMVDRERGTCIVTSAWDSERALISSRELVTPMRDRAAEIVGGAAEVEEWEIGLLHRESFSGEGACSRVTWSKTPRYEIDHHLDFFRSTVLPRLEEIPGFCSASVLVNRTTGRAATAVTYDSRSALEQSRDAARRLREVASRKIPTEIHDIAEMELVLAHLRVPETV